MPIGVLGENFLLSLLGFNLGVEIGQIVVIGCIFPAIYFASKYAYYPRFVMRYGAVAMILIAAYWFVERAFLSVSIAKLMQASLSGIIN